MTPEHDDGSDPVRQFGAGLVPIVVAAHQHGLLDAVKAKPASAAALAAALDLDVRATGLVLAALEAAGFCERDGDGRYHHRVTIDHLAWNHLDTMLKTGEVLPHIDDAAARPAMYGRAVARLAERFAPWAEALAARLPPARRILDVGAGSGVWSLAMAARSPDAEVVAIDFDEVLGNFTSRARAAELEHRVSTLAGSYFEVPVPAGFDRVVLANVLHLETPSDAQALVERFASALTPGGEIVIIDCLAEGTPARDFTRTLYALHLGLRTAKGGVHPASALVAMCERAGLGDTRLELLDDKAPGMGALIASRRRT